MTRTTINGLQSAAMTTLCARVIRLVLHPPVYKGAKGAVEDSSYALPCPIGRFSLHEKYETITSSRSLSVSVRLCNVFYLHTEVHCSCTAC